MQILIRKYDYFHAKIFTALDHFEKVLLGASLDFLKVVNHEETHHRRSCRQHTDQQCRFRRHTDKETRCTGKHGWRTCTKQRGAFKEKVESRH